MRFYRTEKQNRRKQNNEEIDEETKSKKGQSCD